MCGRPNEHPGQGAGGKYCKMYNDLILEATAQLCARLCKDYGIPVRWAKDKGKGIAGHDQFAPSIRCDPGWILNKHQHSKSLGAKWHSSKWKKKHKKYAEKRKIPFEVGALKYPEGNYWDWDDFINRVKKYYNPSSSFNMEAESQSQEFRMSGAIQEQGSAVTPEGDTNS
jgi:hypothetical protein